MKKSILLVCLLTLAACDLQKRNEKNDVAQQKLSQEELVKRGKYLVTISACHDCHSPKVMTPNGPEPDTTRLLSGHPKDEQIPPIPRNEGWIMFNGSLTSFVGPWGVSYAANLTPDETGTGNWTFEQFKTAIRKGKYKGLEGTRDLLPPMPWQMYRNMTDDDLTAVFTYLRSLPPIDNLVPSAIPPNEVQYQLTSNNK